MVNKTFVKSQSIKNPQILLKGGEATFIKLDGSDVGFGGYGKKLTFNTLFDVNKNLETIKEISNYYEKNTGISLNAEFKTMLNQIKEMYNNCELFINYAISNKYDLGVNKGDYKKLYVDNYATNGHIHSIITDVVNLALANLQKKKKFPFMFEVSIQESENYSTLPKMSIDKVRIIMRQKADYKSLSLIDSSIHRLDVKKMQEKNLQTTLNPDGSQLFPRVNKAGAVEYGKNFEKFPVVFDGAVVDVISSVYFNTKSKTLTIYPKDLNIVYNDVVSSLLGDEEDESFFEFDAPIEVETIEFDEDETAYNF